MPQKLNPSLLLNVVLVIIIFGLLWIHFGKGATTQQSFADKRFAEIKNEASKYVEFTKQKYLAYSTKYSFASVSGPLDLSSAKRFTEGFRNSSLATKMKIEGASISNPSGAYFESVYFDNNTLANFANLYQNNSIDGIRIYLAKYPGNNPNYTLIMVGTKKEIITNADGTTSEIHRDQVIKDSIGNVISIQDYGDPCPPPGACIGADVGTP